MFSAPFYDSLGLMLFMLNPFLLLIYMLDLVDELDNRTFAKVLLRASFISGVCYLVFAYLGEPIFNYVFKADFASFQIFGGLIFLITGIRFVFEGNKALTKLKGEPSHVQGGIVMPIMVGPGTISASILIGKKLDYSSSAIVIAGSLLLCVGILILLQRIISNLKSKKEELVVRYIDILGRVSALLIGTFSIEMIMRGVQTWALKF